MARHPARATSYPKPSPCEVLSSCPVPVQDLDISMRARLCQCDPNISQEVGQPHAEGNASTCASFLRTEPGQSPEVIRRAQAIWNEGFSQCRQSGVERKGNFVSGLKLQKKRQDTWMNLVRIMESTYRLSPIPCHCQTEAKYFICQWLSRLRTLFRARLHGSNGDA